MGFYNSLPVQNSKPFHTTTQEGIEGVKAGDVVGMTEDGATLGIYDGASFPVVYGLCLDVVDSEALIIDHGFVFHDASWGLTQADMRLLCKAGVIVE